MAGTTPFQAQGSLVFSPDDGIPQVPLPFNYSGAFASLASARLVMTGAGSLAIPMGSIAAVKALLLEVEFSATSSAPVILHVNGGTDDIEISPGGILMYVNPSPVAGITSITIDRTEDVVVRVHALG